MSTAARPEFTTGAKVHGPGGHGALAAAVERARAAGKRVVFTNGCFDLLHAGHVRLLQAAKAEGDLLVVALNTDASVKRLKGPGRPRLAEGERARVMAALECVDLVTLFDEDTPLRLIERLAPDVLVKGGDWGLGRIVGEEIVAARGGRVVAFPVVDGKSTTALIEKARGG